MENIHLTENITYIGVNDKDIDLFEGQYIVPNGISYNSYLIQDEKICIMDTVDIHKSEEWLNNIELNLKGKQPDYLVVLHMEPDHAGSLEIFLNKYKNCKIVSNAKAFGMMEKYFENMDLTNKKIVVAENDTLALGTHTLHFIMAPMVHWPEVMMAYEKKEKILFAADAFGKFGTLDTDEEWLCEARRYYFNIVGKFGMPVQAVLKKASTLDIQKIFPLHGPMLTENLAFYLNKYTIWSQYQPEDKGVFIAYTSVYGHTKLVAKKLKELLLEKNITVSICDLAREDMAEALEDAFRYDRLVLATTTYDGGIFPAMETFIQHLKAKNYQNRKIALIENGSWAPMAAQKMKAALSELKNISFIEPILTIQCAYKKENEETLQLLLNQLL